MMRSLCFIENLFLKCCGQNVIKEKIRITVPCLKQAVTEQRECCSACKDRNLDPLSA